MRFRSPSSGAGPTPASGFQFSLHEIPGWAVMKTVPGESNFQFSLHEILPKAVLAVSDRLKETFNSLFMRFPEGARDVTVLLRKNFQFSLHEIPGTTTA